MKCLALAAFAASVAFATGAFAQSHPIHIARGHTVHACQENGRRGGGEGRRGGGGGRGGGRGGGASAAAPAGGGAARANRGGNRVREGASRPGGANRVREGTNRGNRSRGRPRGRSYGGQGGPNVTPGENERPGRPGGGRPGRPERPGVGGGGGGSGVGNGRPRPPDWNRPPRNWDRAAYRRNWRSDRRFRTGVWVRPPGWYARRWSYGQFLPRAWWAPSFWLTSWWLYDLMAPPYGYQWVRSGDDAILIDTNTGEILQVRYDVFY